MLNKERHNLVMGQIIIDLYKNKNLSSVLGFKGGTCAYYFYGLPRFSVDLDFDLLQTDKATQKQIFEEVGKILVKHGDIKDSIIKFFTIWFLLSYGTEDHNIKVEINTRHQEKNIHEYYEFKELMGVPMLVPKPEYMFATKLTALINRKTLVMRDVFDIHYFASNNWDIDRQVVELRTGKNFKEYLRDCILVIENIKENELLSGIGELIDAKQKQWVKKFLKSETVALLKNYIFAMQ